MSHKPLAIVRPAPDDPVPAPASVLAPIDTAALVTIACVLDTLVQHVARQESRLRALEAQ